MIIPIYPEELQQAIDQEPLPAINLDSLFAAVSNRPRVLHKIYFTYYQKLLDIILNFLTAGLLQYPNSGSTEKKVLVPNMLKNL